MSRNPLVDRYIADARPFARPLLEAIRERIHAAHDGLEEDLRWRMPCFLWHGRQLAIMAAFKGHVSLSFRHRERAEGHGGTARGMGQFGRMTTLAEVPSAAAMAQDVAQSIAAIEAGTRPSPRGRRPVTDAVTVPPDLSAALAAAGARQAFDNLGPGQQREYVAWIEEAKRPDTRARRIATAVAQASEGKSLHWVYRKG